ncbi:MAG TPA: 50S ribosomal protein L18 [bacterium]|uniref:Large ribosomal subunit protein uL18 n=1 Tax=uncultured bacterium Rifle_16ft_4_minimus_4564 TaxID=1665161 RepID=A0A0H4TCM2_9BACT|nr:50S ribosomal protein L18, large subunit ribosomal protein L18 [uncultured bacterium Rifle_16ft_4_minimus_4564]
MFKNRNRELRAKRKGRLRVNLIGVQSKPRLSVYRSLKHIYVQVIDDSAGRTIESASTLSKELKGIIKQTGNSKAAQEVGKLIAKKLIKKGIKQAVFDRNGFKYHGRVKALADGTRAEGLQI